MNCDSCEIIIVFISLNYSTSKNIKMINESDFSIEIFMKKISHIKGKILSIDFGTKKIGLAMTDMNRSMAFPFEIYIRKNLDFDIKYFLNLITEHKIVGIIIGVALIDDKFLGNKKLFFLIEQFLNKILEHKNLPYLFYNEEYSSHISNENLYEIGLNKNQIARQEDKIVATNFLKEVFDIE